MDVKKIMIEKSLGNFKPNFRLSNMAIAYYEEPQYASKRIFPVCPVQLPSGFFYEFKREDLARDNVAMKPNYGSVAPAIFGSSEQSYSCRVDQIIIGIDRIIALPYQRAQAMGLDNDPYRQRIPTLTEQIALHQEREFAEKFFKSGVWENEWSGAATANVAQKKFKKFDADTSDPITFIDSMATEIKRQGRRRPNKLALGIDTFVALKNNAAVKERIKYSGTTANPAVVTESVLAQIFGLEEVIVLDATYNDAPYGAEANMQYICDSKSALLVYAPGEPQIDAPSAGYIFTWIMDDVGNYISVRIYEGEPATHTELMEGLIAYDMRLTGQSLGVFMKDCVG